MDLVKMTDAKTKIENFKTKNGRYPIYIKDFTISNNLFTSYNSKHLSSNINIENMYKDLYGKNFYNYNYLLTEVNMSLRGESKKTMKYSVLKNNKDRMTILFLYNFYKEHKEHFPNYNEFKNTYYFPFIAGINEKSDLLYENLFEEDEIKKYINKKEYNQIKRSIDLKNVKLFQKEYITKNSSLNDSKIAELLIVKIMETINQKKINKVSTNNTNEFEKNIMMEIKDKNLRELYNKNKETIINDIDSILKLINKNEKYEFLDLNEEQENFKGYDFLLKTENENKYISYKFKKGRTSSNLSLNKLLKKNFNDIIKENTNSYEKAVKYVEKIDDYIHENYLNNIYNKFIEICFKKISELETEENFIESLLDILDSDELKIEVLNNDMKLNNISNEEMYDNVNKIVGKEIISSFTDNKVKNHNTFKKEEKLLKLDVKENLKELSILQNSIFYDEFDKSTYKLEYKAIIKEFYRDNKIMEEVNKEVFPEGNILYDKKIFGFFINSFKNTLKDIEEKLKDSSEYRSDFLKYILHLEINEDNDKSKGYIVSNGSVFETLDYSSIKEYISKLRIKIENVNVETTGYGFDLSILYGNKQLLKFNNNKIKSKTGKFTDSFTVDFSTDIEMDLKLIKNFNQNFNQKFHNKIKVKKQKILENENLV